MLAKLESLSATKDKLNYERFEFLVQQGAAAPCSATS